MAITEGRPTRTKAASRRPRARVVATADGVPVALDNGPLDRYLGYYLRRLYDDYRREFVTQAGDLDVQPREVGALFVIGLNPGLTPSQLGAALALDGAQTTAMLNMFDRRGLLERRVSATDARSRQIHLTRPGQVMLRKVSSFVSTFDRSFSRAALTEEELDQLVALMAKLYAGVSGSAPVPADAPAVS